MKESMRRRRPRIRKIRINEEMERGVGRDLASGGGGGRGGRGSGWQQGRGRGGRRMLANLHA